ncbi:hypothetical protein [Balneola vulgaris]|uniref:hypothetical protein n=1 Tax=Balneola vulgaris TaxID=287535 RepID=UPI0003646A93|nr:hypothetical protein [Balneola vulgaris]
MILLPEKKILEMVSSFPTSHSKNAILNSIIHLRKADDISSIDEKMSYFRIITSMEEISTGLIIGLRIKGYKKAKHINPYNHTEKAMLFNYFVLAFEHFFDFISSSSPRFYVEKSNENSSDKLYLVLKNPDTGIQYQPILPLDFYCGRKNSPGNLNDTLKKYRGNKIIEKVVNASERIAAERNFILYAYQQGIANFDIDFKKLIEITKYKLLLLVSIWILIMQNDRQLFVQQVLDSLQEVLPNIKSDNQIEELIEQNLISGDRKIDILYTKLP